MASTRPAKHAAPARRLAGLALAWLAPVPAGAGPAAATSAQASPGEYVLDARDASLVIILPSFPALPTPVLRLTSLQGRLHLDPANRAATSVTITADPRSYEASGPMARLAAAQFEPDRFPTITFNSTALRWGAGDEGKLVGELTFHGVTRPLTLDIVLRDSTADSSATGASFHFSGRGNVSRSQFGLTQGRPFIGDTVRLVFDMEFVKQPPVRRGAENGAGPRKTPGA